MSIPQTPHDLKRFSHVEVSIMTHLHAVSDGRLLESVAQTIRLPLDENVRTTLTWAVKDFGISYETAMEAYVAEWFKALAEEKQVQQDMRETYPHLPAFRASFSLHKPPTWIQATH